VKAANLKMGKNRRFTSREHIGQEVQVNGNGESNKPTAFIYNLT